MSQRAAPHSLEDEQALLGAILIDNNAFERAARVLDAAHFHDPLHRQVFETLAKVIGAGRLATPMTIKPYFENAEPIGPEPVPLYLGGGGRQHRQCVGLR